MSNPFIKKLFLVMMSLFIISVISGCNGNKKEESKAETKQQGQTKASKENKKVEEQKKKSEAKKTKDKEQILIHSAQFDVADRAAKKAMEEKGVTRATAIVHDKDIVMGIDVDHPDKKVIEKKVHELVQKEEPKYKVHVTSEKELHTKIQEMHYKMMYGHPVRNMATDIGFVIRDIGRKATAPFRK